LNAEHEFDGQEQERSRLGRLVWRVGTGGLLGERQELMRLSASDHLALTHTGALVSKIGLSSGVLPSDVTVVNSHAAFIDPIV